MIRSTLHKPRLSSSERRAAIVEAAVGLFSEKGFRGATTRELAAAAGISEPVLYSHFANKRELYTAIIESLSDGGVEQALARELAPFLGSKDDEGLFTRLGEIVYDWYVDDPKYARLLLFSALERHEMANLFYQRHVIPYLKIVAGYLERRIGEGAFPRADPVLAVRSFTGMVAHFGLAKAVFCPSEQGAFPRDTVVREVVTIFLAGLRNYEIRGTVRANARVRGK